MPLRKSQKKSVRTGEKKTRFDPILFRGTERIGAITAEEDNEYLAQCYVSGGEFDAALDTASARSILLGRTGSGKSATILEIERTQEHVIRIRPQDMAMNFIHNSETLVFFDEIGVNLDPFFQTLWRHVVCVEIIIYHYQVKNLNHWAQVLESVRDLVRKDPAKSRALEYLDEWSGTFWQERQEKMRGVVEKYERDLTGNAGIEQLGVRVEGGAASKLSEETRKEIVDRSRKVVPQDQMRHLTEVMTVIEQHILSDRQKKFYVVIDQLDENWVEGDFRYRLIRALIETIKSWTKIANLKLVVALRTDLLDRVYERTKSEGFQREKYEDYEIPMEWTKPALLTLVERRIGQLCKRQYTNSDVGFYDLFSARVSPREQTFEYLVDRTQYRPRDLITFVNEILRGMKDKIIDQKQKISAKTIHKAEVDYSRKRLDALCDEWATEHPSLRMLLHLLENGPRQVAKSNIGHDRIEAVIIRLLELDKQDSVVTAAKQYFNGDLKEDVWLDMAIETLYRAGAIGIKGPQQGPIRWVFRDGTFGGQLLGRDVARLRVSGMLLHALNITFADAL